MPVVLSASEKSGLPPVVLGARPPHGVHSMARLKPMHHRLRQPAARFKRPRPPNLGAARLPVVFRMTASPPPLAGHQTPHSAHHFLCHLPHFSATPLSPIPRMTAHFDFLREGPDAQMARTGWPHHCRSRRHATRTASPGSQGRDPGESRLRPHETKYYTSGEPTATLPRWASRRPSTRMASWRMASRPASFSILSLNERS